jgi:hypothetical protein
MKIRLTTGLAMLVLILAAGSLQAQSFDITAAIPFPFVVGSQSLPAGQYAFTSMTTRGMVSIWNKGTNQVSAAMFQPGYKPSNDESGNVTLVFHRYGQTYFLSEIRNGASASAYLFRESSTENEHRRASAGRVPDEVVALVARAAR